MFAVRIGLARGLAAVALAGSGCTPAALPPRRAEMAPADLAESVEVTQSEWTLARARLGELRRAQPCRPYVERVRISLDEPRTGRHYQARGAVAVSPERAARMLLVGPGGTTALDLWVSKDAFRFSVPAIGLSRRGGAAPDEARGLPVGLLRWWFLSPLAGRLLFARTGPRHAAWVMRDGRATVTIREDGVRFSAVRREGDRTEAMEWTGRELAPSAGARGRYVESAYGLRVEVLVEEVLSTEPDPGAFDDPGPSGAAP